MPDDCDDRLLAADVINKNGTNILPGDALKCGSCGFRGWLPIKESIIERPDPLGVKDDI